MLLKSYYPASAWAIIILVLTLIPGKAIPEVNIIGIDKVVHFIIFGIQMFLTLLPQRHSGPISNRTMVLSVVGCISFGIMIELLQHFVPGRSTSIYDVIANTIGVALGYLLFLVFRKK